MRRAAQRLAALLLLLPATLASCAEDEQLTALVLVVDSDIEDLDSVRVDVTGFGDQPLTGAELGPGRAPLPRRLGLVHRGGPLGPIAITAEGRSGGEVLVVERKARVFFVRDKVMMLRLNLLTQCVGMECPAGETCSDTGCRSIDVAASELGEWDGEIPPLLSSDPDAGPSDAGGDSDSGMQGGAGTGPDSDAGTDAGPDSGGPAPMCEPDRGNCDRMNGNGCETDLLENANHCGACDEACPDVGSMNITARACVDGECAISCDGADYDDCDGRSSTGCETDLNTTLLHCGACDAACPAAGSMDIETSACVDGECAISCDGVNHDDCDEMVSTGCETDLQTTALHCGECDAACPAAGTLQNATSECQAGGCVPVCDPDWVDDDGMLATGCETASPLFHYTVSNFDPAEPALGLDQRASPTIDCSVAFDTGTTGSVAPQDWCGVTVTPFATTQPGNGAEVVIVPLSGLSVGSTGVVTLTGQRPVIFAVFGDATIAGRINASAAGATPGAGGNTGCGTSTGGVGQGGIGGGGGGGGGGGFATAGALGGSGGDAGSTVTGGDAGALRMSTALSPLIAGCAGGTGGAGDGAGGVGGGGGGAFQLSATGIVTLLPTAFLAAAGGGGRASSSQESGGGGGGSGGAILIEARSVAAMAGAWLTANGGGGAEGNETDSSNGNSGSNGAISSAVAAPGGSGGEFDAGNGGAGGVQGTAPQSGNGGSTSGTFDSNDHGGGGGGGSVGRIHVRGDDACSLDASFSPTSSQDC